MYPDHEIETWGSLFCKYQVYAQTGVQFIQFISMPVDAKRNTIKQAIGAKNAQN